MEKLFCFDVDGTLLDNENNTYPASTIQSLRLLKKKGHKLAISTGRSFQSVEATGLLDLVEWDGLILNNGQVVCDASFKPISIQYLPYDSFQKLNQICIEKHWNYSVETGTDWFTLNREDPNTIQAHEFFNEIIPRQKAYEGEEIVMVMVYGDLNESYEELKLPGLQVAPGVSTYADVFLRDIDKSMGIQKLMDLLKVEEYIAFGDGQNDIEMLENASVGIAMGQSSEIVKQSADFVTKSCHEEGIAYACKQLKFLDGEDYEANTL